MELDKVLNDLLEQEETGQGKTIGQPEFENGIGIEIQQDDPSNRVQMRHYYVIKNWQKKLLGSSRSDKDAPQDWFAHANDDHVKMVERAVYNIGKTGNRKKFKEFNVPRIDIVGGYYTNEQGQRDFKVVATTDDQKLQWEFTGQQWKSRNKQ